jgi:hypothetical protein
MASDNQRRRVRRPKFSNVIAVIALFAVLGGSAYAGSKINGKKIKPGTVTSKALKDKTIKTKDLSDATVSDLQGQQGPKGDTGAQGEQGEQGPAGVLDPSAFFNNGSQNITDNTQTEVASVTVTEGAGYLVYAKLQMFAGNNVTNTTCRIFRGATEIDRISWDTPTDSVNAPIALQAVTPSGGNEITVECEPDGGTGSASFRRLTALPIAG